MKIDINTKIKDLDKDFEKLGEQVVKEIQAKIEMFSKAVYNEGLRLSAEKLGTSLANYQSNLKYEKIGDNIYQIFLVEDSFAEKFEEGFKGFDMKPGFLNSPKAKTTKDGLNKYFDVPFQIQPHAKSRASKRITDMRSAVQAAISDKTVEKRITEFNKDSKGLARFGNVTRYKTGDPRTEGLVNIAPPGGGTSKYFIFRRVSRNSDPSKFLHPGYDGAKIFEELEKFTEKGIEDLLKGILG